MKQNMFETSGVSSFSLAKSHRKIIFLLSIITTICFSGLLIAEYFLYIKILPIDESREVVVKFSSIQVLPIKVSVLSLYFFIFPITFLVFGLFAMTNASIPLQSNPVLRFTSTEMILKLLAPAPFDLFQYERNKISRLMIQEYSFLGRLYTISFNDGSMLRIPEFSRKPTDMGKAIVRFGPAFETHRENVAVFPVGKNALIIMVLLWSILTSTMVSLCLLILPYNYAYILIVFVALEFIFWAITSGNPIFYSAQEPVFRKILHLVHMTLFMPFIVYSCLQDAVFNLRFMEQKEGIEFPQSSVVYSNDLHDMRIRKLSVIILATLPLGMFFMLMLADSAWGRIEGIQSFLPSALRNIIYGVSIFVLIKPKDKDKDKDKDKPKDNSK